MRKKVYETPESVFLRLASRLHAQDQTLHVTFRECPDRRDFKQDRSFAYCETVPGGSRISVAPDLRFGPDERIEGVIAHEFGHAVHFHCDRMDHSERDADALAKALFGFTINYDDQDVQTTGPGRSPRPDYLPK